MTTDRLDSMTGFALRDAARRGIPATAESAFRDALRNRLDGLKEAGFEANPEVLAIKEALDLAPFHGEPYYLMLR